MRRGMYASIVVGMVAGQNVYMLHPRLSHYVVLARFWLLPARCRFSQIQYQADASFTSSRLNFASNATLLRF